MVRRLWIYWAMVSWIGLGSSPAQAVLQQTVDDLAILRDMLETLADTGGLRDQIRPFLLVTPRHYWVESKEDFAPRVTSMLKSVFRDPGDVILCPTCDTHRIHTQADGRVVVQNGELSLAELKELVRETVAGDVKSYVTVRETPQGVYLRIVNLQTGEILASRLADSSLTLGKATPWMHYSLELDRRRRRQGLTYVTMDFGPVFGQGVVHLQMNFLEQWGDRNQHISGLTIGSAGESFGLGISYSYLFPMFRSFRLSGAVLFPIDQLASALGDSEDSALSGLVVQGTLHWSFADSYALFVGASSAPNVMLGLSLLNPIALPFLL